MAGKILIVDDDRDITQIIQLLLEGEGYDTAVAGSGEEALERLDGTVELVILDIMMEGLNGFDTCRLIRQSSYAPILFLSAMSGETEKVAALIAGGDDYLCKPFSAAELIARLSYTEYEILHLFLKRRGQVLSISEIYEAIWTEPYSYSANNIVMVHIYKLRRKLEQDCKHPTILKTAWGKGYYIE